MYFLQCLMIFLLSGCADLTSSGSKVKIVEVEGELIDAMEVSDKMIGRNGCTFIGIIEAKTSLFPGSYSVHDNEIHSALRNRAAKIGANVVVANFYRKPAQGVGLQCP